MSEICKDIYFWRALLREWYPDAMNRYSPYGEGLIFDDVPSLKHYAIDLEKGYWKHIELVVPINKPFDLVRLTPEGIDRGVIIIPSATYSYFTLVTTMWIYKEDSPRIIVGKITQLLNSLITGMDLQPKNFNIQYYESHNINIGSDMNSNGFISSNRDLVITPSSFSASIHSPPFTFKLFDRPITSIYDVLTKIEYMPDYFHPS